LGKEPAGNFGVLNDLTKEKSGMGGKQGKTNSWIEAQISFGASSVGSSNQGGV
jgi:hypothetical protein